MRIMLIIALLSCRMCLAQATDECKPSTLNVPSAQYPCIYPDHRATFRVVAPDANKVQVRVRPYSPLTGRLTFTIRPPSFNATANTILSALAEED
jgi:hypothetical protein